MDDFSLNPVGRAEWYARKTAIDPRQRRRHHEDAETLEEPVDSVVLSTDDDSPEKAADE